MNRTLIAAGIAAGIIATGGAYLFVSNEAPIEKGSLSSGRMTTVEVVTPEQPDTGGVPDTGISLSIRLNAEQTGQLDENNADSVKLIARARELVGSKSITRVVLFKCEACPEGAGIEVFTTDGHVSDSLVPVLPDGGI